MLTLYRRSRLVFLIVAILASFEFAIVTHAGNDSAEIAQPATLVITNANIRTMDPRTPRAEAIAIRGEWIIAIGTVAEIEPFINPGTKVIDAEQRLVIPGFNDAHCHFMGGAQLLRNLNLYGVNTLERVLQLVAERVAVAEPGEWIFGSRYDHTLWGKTWPTKEDLDRIAPDNPVVLSRASGHSAWVNSKVLELSNIDISTIDPPAGEIQRNLDTKEPTGILLETAMRLIKSPRESIDPGVRRRQAHDDFINGFKHAAKLGVTSVQTSNNFEEIQIVREMAEAGELTLRWTGWFNLGDAEQIAERGVRTGQGNIWVRVGFLKGYIDGTLGDGTAAMFDAFTDRPEFRGLPRMTQDELNELVVQADELGFQIGIHAIGDQGSNMVLNAFEAAALQNGTTNRRHRIEHAQLVHPDDIRRFGALGVIASMQPTHCTTDMRFAEPRVGYDRCKTAYAWRSLVDSGAMLSFGTDWSVEPLDPMRGIFSAVTRTNIQEMEPRTGWFPEQKMTVWEAIYYYTVGSAYGENMENTKGSLTPGRLADLVILERDLFTIEPADILSTRVDYTIVGGRIVWDRENGS